MTLERRQLNLTMELGGRGQGMQRTSEDDYFGVLDGWTDQKGRDGQGKP